jgi:hypothetical protein
MPRGWFSRKGSSHWRWSARNRSQPTSTGAEAKAVPGGDDTTSEEEKLERSFWNWVESHDPDNLLAIKIALQQIFAQMELGDLAIVGVLKPILRIN